VTVRKWFDIAGWLACVVYSTIPAFWLMIHPFVARWRLQRRSPYRVLLPLWAAMWIAMALASSAGRQIELYQAGWSWIPAALLFASGLYLYARSSRDFSVRQLGGLPELYAGNREQRLVTEGIRARVRHPIYLAHLCEMVAWSVGTGLAVCWGLTVFALVTGTVMIRLEDAELEKRFGEDYRQYRVSVPALIPRIVKPSQL
jgi:protein-S-isoprenylcysteine O-methyltransferase Ste14